MIAWEIHRTPLPLRSMLVTGGPLVSTRTSSSPTQPWPTVVFLDYAISVPARGRRRRANRQIKSLALPSEPATHLQWMGMVLSLSLIDFVRVIAEVR